MVQKSGHDDSTKIWQPKKGAVCLSCSFVIHFHHRRCCIHDLAWTAFLVLSHIPGVPGEWAIESHISRCRPLFTILPHFIQTGVQSHRPLPQLLSLTLLRSRETGLRAETEKWRKPKLTFSTEWEMGEEKWMELRCWPANKYILSLLCYIGAEVLWF